MVHAMSKHNRAALAAGLDVSPDPRRGRGVKYPKMDTATLLAEVRAVAAQMGWRLDALPSIRALRKVGRGDLAQVPPLRPWCPPTCCLPHCSASSALAALVHAAESRSLLRGMLRRPGAPASS